MSLMRPLQTPITSIAPEPKKEKHIAVKAKKEKNQRTADTCSKTSPSHPSSSANRNSKSEKGYNYRSFPLAYPPIKPFKAIYFRRPIPFPQPFKQSHIQRPPIQIPKMPHHRPPPFRRPSSSHRVIPRHPAILTPSSTTFLTGPPAPIHSTPPAALLRHLSTLLSTYTSTSADLADLLTQNHNLGSRHSNPSQTPPGLRSAINVLEDLLQRVRVRYEEALQENRALRARAGAGRRMGGAVGRGDWGRGVGVGDRDVRGGRGHGHGHGRRGAVFFDDEFDSEGEDEEEWFDSFV